MNQADIKFIAEIQATDGGGLVQQDLRKHRGLVESENSVLFDSSPSQNFDNEKSKVNYKNI